MKIFDVSDQHFTTLRNRRYDIALFEDGIEERCVSVPSRVSPARVGNAIILASSKGPKPRNELFDDAWPHAERITLPSNNPALLLQRLTKVLDVCGKRDLRILVDYSSMPLVWSLGVLTWAAHAASRAAIEVDMVYSISKHRKDFRPLPVEDVIPYLGTEGRFLQGARLIALISLGFDHIAAQAVLERLQPSEFFTVICAPGAFVDYERRAREANRVIIARAQQNLDLSLSSVDESFSLIAQTAVPKITGSNVALVPMGPKPIALASFLVALRYGQIACLHPKGSRFEPESVGSTRRVVATRIAFGGD